MKQILIIPKTLSFVDESDTALDMPEGFCLTAIDEEPFSLIAIAEFACFV